MVRKDYGKNKLTIGEYPSLGIITEGSFTGTPCINLHCGNKLEYTNKQLLDIINEEFPQTRHFLLCGKEPTLFSNDMWSFIKYYKNKTDRSRKFHMITKGEKYIPKFLYELDNIIINIQSPSTGMETPPEFISWCNEDKYLKNKTECFFIVNANLDDINFARYEGTKIGTYSNPITIRQGSGWDSHNEFIENFIISNRYPNVRLMPNYEEIA